MTLQTTDERMVHVVTGTGTNARIRDLRLADVIGSDSLDRIADHPVVRTNFLRRCAAWLEIGQNELDDRTVDVTDEGHVIVSAPKRYA